VQEVAIQEELRNNGRGSELVRNSFGWKCLWIWSIGDFCVKQYWTLVIYSYYPNMNQSAGHLIPKVVMYIVYIQHSLCM